MQIAHILEEKRREILQIVRNHGAGRVRVFGSGARNELSPSSDFDFLVSLNSGRTILDLIAIEQDLEDLLGCQVDVVTETGISPYIKEQVLREAVDL